MARVQFTEDTRPEAAESPPRRRSQPLQRRRGISDKAKLFSTQVYWTAGLFIWFALLHAAGIFLFGKGFLLTRLVLPSRSECSAPPVTLQEHKSKENVCWYPPTFSKAVVVVIDALRYDFTVPHKDEAPFHNALTVMHELAVSKPENAFLLPFIADPPTATLQRIKGFTTGTLPTFIDLGSNFAGTAIDEDNLLAQMLAQNRTVVHVGDDTWHALFPDHFEPNLTRPYESFQVWDLFTVDNGVTEHILPYLKMSSRWDLMIGHYLGVDHAGHRYGPDHPQMTVKLKEMDTVIRQMVKDLPDDTLLVVFGDHGMDQKGDHGGDTDDEVEAALWMYSKKPAFGRTSSDALLPPPDAKTRPVAQIDLVPTLALLLGLPVPFSNLGSPIPEAFIGPKGASWDVLAKANMLTAAQIRRYQAEYALARGADAQVQMEPNRLWEVAEAAWRDMPNTWSKDTTRYRLLSDAWRSYMAANLEVCKDLWANFDIPCMIMGIFVLALGVGAYMRFARSRKLDAANSPAIVVGAFAGAVLGAVMGFSVSLASNLVSGTDLALLGSSTLSVLGATYMWQQSGDFDIPRPNTIWGGLAVFVTLGQSIGFASNSYTIWEDEMSLFFLGTFGLLAACSSFRQKDDKERALGIYHSVLFLFLTRAASFSRLCREEQGGLCNTTFYPSANTSTPAAWHLAISYMTAIVFPLVIRTYYENTGSYVGTIVPWIKFAFAPGLALTAAFWSLNAADDGNWIENISEETLGNSKRAIALMVLFTAFVVGILAFVWTIPPLNVDKVDTSELDQRPGARPIVSVAGLNNLHGSRYSFLVTSFLLGVILLQKPMGGGVMALCGWQIFSLLEIVHTNRLRNSSFGPILLALLGNFYFFKTGHQATPQSIQWDVAFVPLATIRYPWTPLVLIVNTYGPQLLAAIAVPLLVLWRQQPKAPRLLRGVIRACATHVGYYATLNAFTVAWTAHLRRHLMLYKIFSPRFMMSSMLLLLVELVTVLAALLGFRTNTMSVAEIFGWP